MRIRGYDARQIDVGGHRLFIYCTGTGSPTVVLDSGLGDSGFAWGNVSHGVAAFARVCFYDRAGLGSSDPAPMPRTSQQVVADLHVLLTKAAIRPPYVLVGHSFGGMNVRLYAGEYPQEVAGMVLVESVHPDQFSRIGAVIPAPRAGESRQLHDFRAAFVDDITHPERNPEGVDIDASVAQVRRVSSLGAIPLVVISRGRAEIEPPELAGKAERIWQDLQTDLLGLSSNSIQIKAERSGHGVPGMQPDLIVTAIRKVVDAVRMKSHLKAP